MPIKLQKRSNILCLAVHFRLLGADKDPQSKKSCKKSEIFVFATGRSLRQAPKDARVEEAQRGVPGIDKRFADGLESGESTGGVATTVRIHREGKRAAPHKASRQNHTSQQGQQGRICERHRVLATAAGQNPRNSHESQRGQERPHKNSHGPQQRQRGESHEGGLRQWRPARQDKGAAIQIRCARQRRVRRNFSADPSKKINRYAIEASHSTMQLFRNGLESGTSALTMRNLASPSAVFQTSVRRRTPGRTGEVKRHLKRVIASGWPGNSREIA